MDDPGRIDPGLDATQTSGGQRARKRDSLFLSARLRLGGADPVHEVRVRNLSADGLMAEVNRTVAPGTPVELEMRGLGTLTGSVVWCTRGRIGVALDHAIDPARARKPVGTGSKGPSSLKPLTVRAPRR